MANGETLLDIGSARDMLIFPPEGRDRLVPGGNLTSTTKAIKSRLNAL